jgi:hypothetical protein
MIFGGLHGGGGKKKQYSHLYVCFFWLKCHVGFHALQRAL